MKPTKMLIWDIEEVAAALRIDVQSVRKYFTDGRRVAFLIERRIALLLAWLTVEAPTGKLGTSRAAAFIFVPVTWSDLAGRSIPRVSCASSWELQAGWCQTLSPFRWCHVAMLKLVTVETWWQAGRFRSTTKISRETMLELVQSLP